MAKKNQKNTVEDVLRQISEKDLRKFVSKELGIQEVLDDFMTEFKKYFHCCPLKIAKRSLK